MHFLFFCIPLLFCIWFSLFEVVHKFFGACGVNYTTCQYDGKPSSALNYGSDGVW
jgi:hypothetical protein